MKYVLLTILIIFLIVMCAPSSGTLTIRNVPILVTVVSVAAVVIAYYFITYLIFSIRVKRICKGKEGLVAIPLVVRKKNCKYHFEEINRIEIYKTTRVMFKVAGFKSIRPGESQTKLVKKKRIRISEDILKNKSIQKYVVINKMPSSVTDRNSRQELGNGDALCNTDVKLYDYKAFEKHMNS